MTTDAIQCDSHELVSLLRAGDIQALDRITRCFGDRLLWVGRRYCRNEEEAQDAVQDAMLAAGQHLSDFRGEGSVEGWLVRMVANACSRMRRGRKNDHGLHATELDLPARDDTPEELAGRGEIAIVLGELLSSLSPDDRVIVMLAEAEGWTGPQIADELGLTAGAVRTRLTRLRRRLRGALEERLGDRAAVL